MKHYCEYYGVLYYYKNMSIIGRDTHMMRLDVSK